MTPTEGTACAKAEVESVFWNHWQLDMILLWDRVANRLVNEARYVARVHLQLSDDYCSVNGHDEVALKAPGKGFTLCPEDVGETWTILCI